MKSDMGVNRPQETKLLHRLLAMLLCIIMVFSVCGNGIVVLARELDSWITTAIQELEEKLTQEREETREEIKERLMRQIRYEGWDPYSSDMTLDEFYALMELFDEGKLPLDSAANPRFGAYGMEGPSIEGEGNVIPRTMFMFRGLPTENGDGSPFEYHPGDEPLPYDNNDNDTYPNYPAGLDPYGLGYQVPPTSWQGVSLGTKTQVVIAVEGQNDNDNSIAGNVVQNLFKDYRSDYGYYVRRVTAENSEATVLGAIKLNDKIVYYYLTDEKQSTEVSTTMLADGMKFIVEYSPIEHLVEYEVHWEYLEGDDITANTVDVNVLGIDLADTWENIIFGASHPNKTDGSAYSFTASVPYGYTVEFYLVKTTDEENGVVNSENRVWGDPSSLLGMDAAGSFTDVNGGWALGMEPDYKSGTATDATIRPSNGGPSTLTMSGNIFNNGVHHDRKIIAVVHKNADPAFFVAPIYHNTNNVNGRGTSAYTFITATNKATGKTERIPYDYEDVYLWENGAASKYDYTNSGLTNGGAAHGNIKDGNVATDDGWNWTGGNSHQYKDSPVSMTREADGTYSYQWTWQTNSESGGFTMDSLEINGVAVTIPFFPKRSLRPDYRTGTNGGSTAWYTEADIGNGIHVKVEFLMVFNPGGNPQRVYRITATGARSNVTISAMNLIMGTGAAEFVTYQITGVTDNTGTSSVEYYNDGNEWKSTPQGSITVKQGSTGINFDGDSAHFGANFRFKLSDGYASPYFLWESTQAGIISNQSSAQRDADGNVILTALNSVITLDDVGDVMDSQHVYGPDSEGWYYIRVNTQDNYKVALLTIGAKTVRYVVRYIPSTSEVSAPTGMPTFDHTNESDFEISSEYADQYDTANGNYYDVTVDNVIILPNATPSDPNSKFKFVDWVLVDIYGNPIEQDGVQFHYSVTHINLIDVVDYAIQNDNLGGAATDIYVLRLMPTWEPIKNPFHYNVALNWVDVQGNLHEEYFDDYWLPVLTDWKIDDNNYLTVQVIKDAVPFLDWIANHPTYNFWDDVNNALSDQEIRDALNNYVSANIDRNGAAYRESLAALLNMDKGGSLSGDDFLRLGSYAYQVCEDEGTIVVWMFEDKGGLAFRKDVRQEAFIHNDEFYFTVSQVIVAGGKLLNGTYKAYPEIVYDDNGNVRARRDSDAWLVEFKDGEIVSIVKNDGSAPPRVPITHFTLKNGEGIELYIQEGEYTITELGSKSGGTYRVEVTYEGEKNPNPPDSNWTLPKGEQWLQGREKKFFEDFPAGVSQVSVSVEFTIGEANMVKVLQFCNQTSSLSIEKIIDSLDDVAVPGELFALPYTFQVKLKLPQGYMPLGEEGHYYFHLKVYSESGAYLSGSPTEIELTKGEDDLWTGTITLKAGQRAAIVMTVPDQGGDINYWVSEDDPGYSDDIREDMTTLYTNNEGKVQPAECAEVEVVNWYGDLPGDGYLVITQEGGDPGETFLYRITDKNGKSIIVSVKGGGCTYVYAPMGKYTIEEITDWAWRYEDGECRNPATGTKTATVRITQNNDEPAKAVHADFTNAPNDKVWLGGENRADNRFAAIPTIGEEEENTSGESEAAMLAVYNDEKRKIGMTLQFEPCKRKNLYESDLF